MTTAHSQIAAGLLIVSIMTFAWAAVPHPIAGLALALLPLVAIVGLRVTYLACLAFIIFSFFRLHEAAPVLEPLKLPKLLALASFVTLAWSIAFQRIRVFWDPLFTPFVMFFVAVCLGILAATNSANSLSYFKDTYIKIGIMVFAVAWSFNRERDLRVGNLIIVVAAGLIATVALLNKLQGIGLVEGTRVTIGRDIGSVLGDPNDLSLVLLFGASFAISAALGRGLPRLDRYLGLLVFCAVAAAIVATQSRGGLLGLVAVTGVFVAERIKSKSILIFVGIFAALALFGLSDIGDRQSGGSHEEGIDESAMGRIYAWGAAVRMAMANPITGVGLDNFYLNYFFYSDHWDGLNHAVHSTWFGVLGEAGFVGLILFGWMVLSILQRQRKTKSQIANLEKLYPVLAASNRGLMGGTIGFCVGGSFLTQAFTWPIYIILGLTIATSHIANAAAGTRNTEVTNL